MDKKKRRGDNEELQIAMVWMKASIIVYFRRE